MVPLDILYGSYFVQNDIESSSNDKCALKINYIFLFYPQTQENAHK